MVRFIKGTPIEVIELHKETEAEVIKKRLLEEEKINAWNDAHPNG